MHSKLEIGNWRLGGVESSGQILISSNGKQKENHLFLANKSEEITNFRLEKIYIYIYFPIFRFLDYIFFLLLFFAIFFVFFFGFLVDSKMKSIWFRFFFVRGGGDFFEFFCDFLLVFMDSVEKY